MLINGNLTFVLRFFFGTIIIYTLLKNYIHIYNTIIHISINQRITNNINTLMTYRQSSFSFKKQDSECLLKNKSNKNEESDTITDERLASIKFTFKENTLLVGEYGDLKNLHCSDKVAAFDFDETLATVLSPSISAFPRYPSDFRLLYNTVPDKILDLYYKYNYSIVILSNQRSMVNKTIVNDKQFRIFSGRAERLVGEIEKAAERRNLKPPPLVLLASLTVDWYRKPCPGMWDYFVSNYCNSEHFSTENDKNGSFPNPEKSFYVGDAAGRDLRYPRIRSKDKGGSNIVDHSDCDYKLALNIGCKYFLPEDIFNSDNLDSFKDGPPTIDHIGEGKIPSLNFDSKSYFDELVNVCELCKKDAKFCESKKTSISDYDKRIILLDRIPRKLKNDKISLINVLIANALQVNIEENQSILLPKIIILSGPTGSGKTLFSSNILQKIGYARVASNLTLSNIGLLKLKLIKDIKNIFQKNIDRPNRTKREYLKDENKDSNLLDDNIVTNFKGVVIDGIHDSVKVRRILISLTQTLLEEISKNLNLKLDSYNKDNQPFFPVAQIEFQPPQYICVHNAMLSTFRRQDAKITRKRKVGMDSNIHPNRLEKTSGALKREYLTYEQWKDFEDGTSEIVDGTHSKKRKRQQKERNTDTVSTNNSVTCERTSEFVPMFDDKRWFMHLV